MRLKKSEWEQLDDLIGKIGFGGYYDLIECLKSINNDLLTKIIGKQVPDVLTKAQELDLVIDMLRTTTKKAIEEYLKLCHSKA